MLSHFKHVIYSNCNKSDKEGKLTHMSDQVKEMHTLLVEGQYVLTLFSRIGHSLDGKEAGAKQRPLLKNLCREKQPIVTSQLHPTFPLPTAPITNIAF